MEGSAKRKGEDRKGQGATSGAQRAPGKSTASISGLFSMNSGLLRVYLPIVIGKFPAEDNAGDWCCFRWQLLLHRKVAAVNIIVFGST